MFLGGGGGGRTFANVREGNEVFRKFLSFYKRRNSLCVDLYLLVVKAGMSFPPFLIMKDEGEVWQLATGETIVCWKCGQGGHIGDKCRQAVNTLAESIASTAVGNQPSWAHVVQGGVSVAPQPPPLPPPVMENPHLFRNPFKATNIFFGGCQGSFETCCS